MTAKVRDLADLNESASLKTLDAAAIVLVAAIHQTSKEKLVSIIDSIPSRIDQKEALALAALLSGGQTIASLHSMIEARGAAFEPRTAPPSGSASLHGREGAIAVVGLRRFVGRFEIRLPHEVADDAPAKSGPP